VEYLMKSDKMSRLEVTESIDLPPNFTSRVVAETAIFDPRSTLSRWLYYMFGAASLLGISVFAFVRYYVTPRALRGIEGELFGGNAFETLFPWLQQWVSSSTFTYVAMSAGAVLLSVTLIGVVDLVQQLSPQRHSRNN
jgi:hypothetical protein